MATKSREILAEMDKVVEGYYADKKQAYEKALKNIRQLVPFLREAMDNEEKIHPKEISLGELSSLQLRFQQEIDEDFEEAASEYCREQGWREPS